MADTTDALRDVVDLLIGSARDDERNGLPDMSALTLQLRGRILATPAGSASGEDKAIANVRVLKDGRWFWSPRIGKPLKDLPEGDHELVLASDYAALQAEVARLRDDNETLMDMVRVASAEMPKVRERAEAAEAEVARLREDAERLDYIERTFSGMTNRERYLPVQMIWGKGCNGRTLREACDKYMKRDAAMGSANGQADAADTTAGEP